VETMLQAGHADVVLVDTMDELPGPADVQLAHLKLRALCLPDSSVAEDKWLSALEGTRWLDYIRSCLRKASDVSVLVTSRVRSVVLQVSWTPPSLSFLLLITQSAVIVISMASSLHSSSCFWPLKPEHCLASNH
jgi:hypothetical protein